MRKKRETRPGVAELEGSGLSLFNQNRGQVTIFIIVAILIIGLAAMIYFLIPKTQIGSDFDAQNPEAFIQNCLENRLEEVVSTISSQGGSVVPEFYVLYNGDKVEYLCYTNEFYKTCVIQQPMLKQHIEKEIKASISSDVQSCFKNLKENYESKGYSVILQDGRTDVELLPKRIAVTFTNYVLTITKAETKRHDAFNIVLNNNLYELTSIANSIINWEAAYGNAETTAYMAYYKDLKVEKHTQQDGTKIYIIIDRNTENKFQFASRSIAWPPGFST